MKIHPFFCFVTLAVTFSSLTAAEPSNERQSEAYRASVAQDRLKKDVSSIQTDFAQLREEMRQFMPEDVELVDRAFQQLGSLSRNEMDKAIAALQDASRTGDMQGQLKKLASAFKDQSSIGLSLKRLAVDLNARQSVAGLGSKVSDLLRRQVAAMTEIGRLGQKEQMPANLRDTLQRRHQVVSGDQAGVADDAKILVKQIDDLAQNLSDESQKKMVKLSALGRDRKLVETADNSVKHINEGPFDQAVATQRENIKTLVLMEQILASDAKTESQLRTLVERLSKAIMEQKYVRDDIHGYGNKTVVLETTKRLQLAITDDVVVLQAQAQLLSVRGARLLGDAQETMTKAMANYDRMRDERDKARENSQTALQQLEAAKEAIEQQIAATTVNPETPQQLANALAALQRDTAQAAAEQLKSTQAVNGTNPPPVTPEQQAALQTKVEDLQQAALPIAPEAAQALARAAEQMQSPDAASQQAAAQTLEDVAKMLAEQQAALAGTTPEQQALAKAEKAIAQAAKTAEQAQANLQKAQTSAQATNQLNAAKQQTAAAQQAAQAAGAPPEAAQALAQAAQALSQAQMAAAQVKLPQAQAQAQAAQQALAQAQQAIAQASQQIAQQAASSLASAQPSASSPASAQPPASDGPPSKSSGKGDGGPSADNLAGIGPAGEPAQVVTGLDPQDRAAVTQLQNEKVPSEFVSQVRQYYKNLADGAGL